MLLAQNYVVLQMAASIFFLEMIFRSRYFSFLDKYESGRISNLDGLRFFLSISVVFHHMVFNHNWIFHGVWSIGDYPINGALGRFGVALFFMLSAYLLSARPIQTPSEFLAFYLNRIFRILPMAWVSSLLCLAVAVYVSGINFQPGLVEHLMYWFDAGLTSAKPDINGFYGANLINAGVMWTLPWEWFLYFGIPVLSKLRHHIGDIFISQAALFASVFFLPAYNAELANYVLCFACGFMARDLRDMIHVDRTIGSIIMCVCIFLVFANGEDPLSRHNIFIEFVLFFVVCQGADFFGVLRARGIVRLGEVSYSMYLLHGIIFFGLNKMSLHHGIGPIGYQIVLFLGIVLITLCACFCFVWVEKPGITIGRRIVRGLRSRCDV